MSGGILALAQNPNVCQARITPVSNTPFTTGQYSAITSLYVTPTGGNLISLFNGSVWFVYFFSELSLSVPATTNTIYDLFIYNNAGTLTLATLAWTNDTTRATSLVYQNGVLVLSTHTNYRYLGSFRTNGTTGHTQLDNTAQYVWNYYNKHNYCMQLRAYDNSTTSSWNITSAVGRVLNANIATTTFNILNGWPDDYLQLESNAYALTVSSFVGSYNMGWGIDSATTISGFGSTVNYSNPSNLSINFVTPNLLGKHTYSLNEVSTYTSGTATIISADGHGGYGYQHCMVAC